MAVDFVAKETGSAVSYSRLFLYHTVAPQLRPGTSCLELIAGVGQAAAQGPRGEKGRTGNGDWKMMRSCGRVEGMISGRGDRGLDCPENLGRGVEEGTDHGYSEAAPFAQPNSFYSSVFPYASRIVLVWKRMSPVGLSRANACRRQLPFRAFLGRARDEAASNTVQRR